MCRHRRQVVGIIRRPQPDSLLPYSGDPDDHFAGSDPIVGEIFGQHLYGVQAILLWWRGQSSIKLPRMVWRNLPS